jgi:hypothetical protein
MLLQRGDGPGRPSIPSCFLVTPVIDPQFLGIKLFRQLDHNNLYTLDLDLQIFFRFLLSQDNQFKEINRIRYKGNE